MDYALIDQIMTAKSLAADPAFEKLTISIEPTPNLDGCPLGLYYPDAGRIVLPPDSTEAALLHELGHRSGHFYYGDLSENYAEYFRKIYQPKGRTLLYMGNDFSNLPRFGALFEEGERGTVEIALLQPLTPDDLLQLKSQLYSYGERPEVYYGNSEIPWVRVEFIKGIDWMVIIGSILAGTTAAGIGAIGYAVYKTAETTPWVIPMSLAGVGALLLLRAAMRQEKVKARIPL